MMCVCVKFYKEDDSEKLDNCMYVCVCGLSVWIE